MAFYDRLEESLGISGLRSDWALAEVVERRLPSSTVKALIRAGLSDSEAYDLIVPRRTLAHRVARHEPLSIEESDKAMRIARVAVFAEQTFGDHERAWRWLRKPKQRFNGKTPVELLTTEASARLVEEMLSEIDHGMAV